MIYAIQYLINIQNLITQVIETQSEKIAQTAEIMANTLANDGYIYVFGTGHSHMMAEELFYRAGGLTRIYPILEESLMLHNGAIKSTEIERLSGYAQILFEPLKCTSNDTIIICSNSGRNNVVVEMALIAKSIGMPIIALTNLNHSQSVDSRHESGKKLYQLADVVLDNQGVIGDAAIRIPQFPSATGASSTVIGAAILHALEVATIENLLSKSIQPEVYQSSNLDGSETMNAIYFEKYRRIIKDL